MWPPPCTIANWVLTDADMAVNVLCFDEKGAAKDSGFSAFYYIPAGDRTGAYAARPKQADSDSYTPRTHATPSTRPVLKIR